MIERVVEDVDSIVKEVTAGNSGWAVDPEGRPGGPQGGPARAEGQRPPHRVEGLFDRAYEYIAEHY